MLPVLLELRSHLSSEQPLPVIVHDPGEEQCFCPLFTLSLIFVVSLACTLTISFVVDIFANEFFEPVRFRSHAPAAARNLLDASCPTYRVQSEKPQHCCICLEDLQRNVLVRELPCSHVYHSGCIERWILECSNRCCLCGQIAVKENCIAKEASRLF